MERLEAGATFGPYTIEGFIAAGGMGEVYAGRHSVYGSPVALKFLHEQLHADDDWRRRFNEEGVVGQQLKHPHVLAARELVEESGRVAMVMDLVRGGQTLHKVITREFATGLPLVTALQTFLGILQGVEYAHGKGVVHGDIKPENVLLQGTDFRDPATWVPMVTDFGTVGLLAHPVYIDGQAAVVASPRYASPEHLQGMDKVDVRSDVYSLGLLLHFLLTGRHASDARTVEEAAQVVVHPISLVQLVDQPESVMALVRGATAVDPAERYQSCRELALAIRSALDELGVKLELEDLQADLATEVIEERIRMKREAEALTLAAEAAGAQDTATPPEDQETELDLSDETKEGAMARKPEDEPGDPPAVVPPPRKPDAPASDDDEDAVARNPLWGIGGDDAGDDDEDDLSEAPTARLTPTDGAFLASAPDTPAGAPGRTSEAPTLRLSTGDPDAAPASPPATRAPTPVAAPAAPGGVPPMVWVAGAVAVVILVIVAVMMVHG